MLYKDLVAMVYLTGREMSERQRTEYCFFKWLLRLLILIFYIRFISTCTIANSFVKKGFGFSCYASISSLCTSLWFLNNGMEAPRCHRFNYQKRLFPNIVMRVEKNYNIMYIYLSDGK